MKLPIKCQVKTSLEIFDGQKITILQTMKQSSSIRPGQRPRTSKWQNMSHGRFIEESIQDRENETFYRYLILTIIFDSN